MLGPAPITCLVRARTAIAPPRARALVLILLWAFGPAAVAGEIALLPVEAQGLLPGAREQLEADVRRGLVEAGAQVQDPEKTSSFVADAVAAGLSCSLTDDACARKAAAAAEVEAVVVGHTVPVAGRVVLVLRYVDAANARGVAAVIHAAGSAHDASAPAACARRLLGKEPTPPTPLPVALTLEPADADVFLDGGAIDASDGLLWLTPGTHRLRVARPGYDEREVTLSIRGDDVPAPVAVALEKSFPVLTGVGIGIAAAGGVVASLFGLLTLAVEDELAHGVPRQDLEAIRGLGQFVLGVTILGATGIVGGSALAVVGGLE